MTIKVILKSNEDTINRINGLLDDQHKTLFSEYCRKYRGIGKVLESIRANTDDAAVKAELTERLDKWQKRAKKEGKAKKQVAPVASYQDLKNKRQQLEKELQQVDEQLQKAKFNEFDNAVKTLLRDNVTKDELINRINDLAK